MVALLGSWTRKWAGSTKYRLIYLQSQIGRATFTTTSLSLHVLAQAFDGEDRATG